MSSLFEIDPVVFQEEVEDVKSIWTDRQTDSGQNVIIKAHFSFQLRLAKKMKNKRIRCRFLLKKTHTQAINKIRLSLPLGYA